MWKVLLYSESRDQELKRRSVKLLSVVAHELRDEPLAGKEIWEKATKSWTENGLQESLIFRQQSPAGTSHV